MNQFHAAMPHGAIQEVFPDVFFVTGTMKNEFFGSMWHFSRNMTVVREGRQLTIINAVRLGPEALAALDELGQVVNLVRIGDMHGVDDAFYADRYQPTYWTLPGMTAVPGLSTDKLLVEGGPMPLADASLFVFRTTQRPEAILRLNREGGIMIACDSLQNWVAPDEFFDAATIAKMREMNFFAEASLGLAWIHGSVPQAEDFVRLKAVAFRHALCAHGVPRRDTAQQDYHAAFQRFFQV